MLLCDMSHTQIVQEQSYGPLTLRVHALTHVTRYSSSGGALGETRELDGRFQLEAELKGGNLLVEPGAFQYSVGDIQATVEQQVQGNFLSRAIRNAGTGESAFATRFEGQGKVFCEPTRKHFVIADSSGEPGDDLLLDDKAFYVAQGTMKLGVHTHASVSGLFSGNGLRQPKLSGAGVFAVESPVPVSEVEVIELKGRQKLVVDGDLVLMYSSSLSVKLRPLVRGLRNALRSGEGVVFEYSGEGTIYLTPTVNRLSVANLAPGTGTAGVL